METKSKVKVKHEVKKAKKAISLKKGAISLQKAKRFLVRNDLTEIAKEVGVTRHTVSNVLAGRTENYTVAEKIVSRAEHNKSIKERAEAL